MKIFFLFTAILFTTAVFAQRDYLAQVKNPIDHPRLLMLKGEEAGVKQLIGSDKTWKTIHEAILSQCDTFLTAAPVEKIKIGKRLLDKSRECLRRVFYLSYAYRITGEEKYLKRAEKEMLAVSAFSDWNPSHFLDVAEMTMAVSIGYDWLYDHLSEQSRSVIRAAIMKNGLEASRDPKNSDMWLKASHNWNQVCNAGISFGAIATYEDHPAVSKALINRAIQTIDLPMKEYGPDGGYQEGYGYWEYGTTMNVLFISALDKLYGQDFGLTEKPGFLKTARFLENMTGPTEDAFNYSDGSSHGVMHPAMFWFANQLHDPSLLFVERSLMQKTNKSEYVRDRLLPALLLWGSGLNLRNIAPPGAKVWVGEGNNPVALMRTSWTDSNAVYIAMKGGSAAVNHAHMDVGSFIMDAAGERWAMDFGSQGYETLESKGVDLWNMKQNSQRWEVFRYNNFSHNTLTVNNQYQKVAGYAPISSYSNQPAFMNAITDLTQVYQGDLEKAVRGVAIINQQYVVVRDEVQTLPKETTIRWTMATPAEPTITGKNEITLTQHGKKLTLKVLEPAEVTMKTWPTSPVHDYDAPNPGTALAGFEAKLLPGSRATLSVMLIPEKAAGSASAQKVLPLDQWPKAH